MIRPQDHVDELVEKYPKLSIFLRRRGIICVQCGEVFWGTLEELIKSKGLDSDQIMTEINSEFGKE